MENAKEFYYKGIGITFQTGDNIMINATEMAKPFGKQPSDWLKTSAAVKFIRHLETVRKILRSALIQVVRGGTNQGTWMHEDVALEFARWLSPEFAIWTNDRTKELLTIGMTALPDTLEKLANDPELLIILGQNLKDERERNTKLHSKVVHQKEQLKVALPKAEYHDRVISTNGMISTTTIALNLGISAQALNVLLHDKGIQYRGVDCWVLYHPYHNKGYVQVKKTKSFNDGELKIHHWMHWTPKGEKFIYDLFAEKPMKRTKF